MTTPATALPYGWPVRVGQTVAHKEYGLEFKVQEYSGSRVRIKSERAGAESQGMLVEQLYEHYKPLD